MNEKRALKRIRAAEAELAYATPERAAYLVSKLVRWKSTVFKH